MCGITGIVVKNQLVSPQDLSAALRRVVAQLRHRGPDDEGVAEWPEAGVYLGHRRLSIIDLSASGHQPMFNEDRSVAVVFNGEIYNFQALRAQLQSRHAFVSTSDTEVLLHAYEEWGPDFVARLEGMFAFALYDQKNRRLMLARDPLGIKPLYWVEAQGWLAFASEARALMGLQLPGWGPGIDREAVQGLLLGMYLADPQRTLIDGVRKLPAGHMMIVEQGRAEVRPYWQLRRTENLDRISAPEAVDRTRQLLSKVVADHLVADVEVGVLLSGGLDSSLVAALAQKASRKPLATFTAGFPHVSDERSYARTVADHIGSRHQEVFIDPVEAVKRLVEIIPTFDDLGTVDGGIVMIYLVAEQIRARGIKVLLVGEGGDETFGGYSWFGVAQQPFRSFPLKARAALCHYATSRMLGRFSEGTELVAGAFRESGERDPFRQVQYWELHTQLPNHYLMKVDKATMAHGVEARVPYLDRRMVQWAYNLPSRVLLPGRWCTLEAQRYKWVLRQVAARELPSSIFTRRKRGFSLPLHDLIQANLPLVKECLLSADGLPASLFRLPDRESFLRYRYSGYHPIHKQREWMTWKLFLLELWRRAVMK